jgi:hypothetical protein
MFNEYQLENWEQDHLWACYWYLEMLLDKTPHHEEGHRRSVEPSFKAPNPVPQSAKKASNASNGGGRKSKDKMKGTAAAAQGVTREAASRAKKHNLTPDASESTKRSKFHDDQIAQNDPIKEPSSQLLNVSSKVISQSTRGFEGNDWDLRSSLVHRDLGGRKYFDTILNFSIPTFMNNKDALEKLSRFASKVCSHVNSCYYPPLVLMHSMTCIIKVNFSEGNNKCDLFRSMRGNLFMEYPLADLDYARVDLHTQYSLIDEECVLCVWILI